MHKLADRYKTKASSLHADSLPLNSSTNSEERHLPHGKPQVAQKTAPMKSVCLNLEGRHGGDETTLIPALTFYELNTPDIGMSRARSKKPMVGGLNHNWLAGLLKLRLRRIVLALSLLSAVMKTHTSNPIGNGRPTPKSARLFCRVVRTNIASHRSTGARELRVDAIKQICPSPIISGNSCENDRNGNQDPRLHCRHQRWTLYCKQETHLCILYRHHTQEYTPFPAVQQLRTLLTKRP
jgi:hypothetical protein